MSFNADVGGKTPYAQVHLCGMEHALHHLKEHRNSPFGDSVPFMPVGHSFFVKDPVMFAEVIQDVLYKFCPYPVVTCLSRCDDDAVDNDDEGWIDEHKDMTEG